MSLELAALIVSIVVPTGGGTILWIRSAFDKKNKRIEVLETIVDAKDDLINELRNDKLKLEVGAEAATRFFNQLPASFTQKQKEIQ